MNSINKLESYMMNLSLTNTKIDENTWLIDEPDKGLVGVVVMIEEPLVIIRVSAMKIPKQKNLELFRSLLELNASDLLHGAYAIEGDEIILVDTLEYDTMDLEEFQASLDAIGLALVEHYAKFCDYRKENGGE